MELKLNFGVIIFVSSVFALVNCKLLLSDKHDVLIKKNCVIYKLETINKTKLQFYDDPETYIGMCKVNNTYYQCSKVKYETKQRIIMDTNTKLVPTTVCCEGYEEIDQKCAPICKKPCENGYCSTPNQCKCNENYTLTEISSEQHCQPICDNNNNCKYGNCTEPNVCKCWNGYESNGELIGCEPVCKSNCTYGQCIEPDKCVCNPNYYFNESMDACQPICSPFCIFGECIEPDGCGCYVGYQLENGFFYQLNESKNVCRPICDFNENCTNGVCSAPGRYDCYDNFELRSGYNCTCLPISTDNWYKIILPLAIFAVAIIIIMIIILTTIHFRRKVNYCPKDEVDWPVYYNAYDL